MIGKKEGNSPILSACDTELGRWTSSKPRERREDKQGERRRRGRGEKAEARQIDAVTESFSSEMEKRRLKCTPILSLMVKKDLRDFAVHCRPK